MVQTYDEPQYFGAFWTAASSRIYFEPTIDVESGMSNGRRSFRIEWEGPEGTDPRNISTIEMALREHEKLVDLVLPHSTKGYEIYSWDAGSENWRFTLIVGRYEPEQIVR